MIWSERTTVTRDAILELNLVTLIPRGAVLLGTVDIKSVQRSAMTSDVLALL